MEFFLIFWSGIVESKSPKYTDFFFLLSGDQKRFPVSCKLPQPEAISIDN